MGNVRTKKTKQPSEERSGRWWIEMPESELVRLAQQGNATAFGELVRRTTDVCLRMATCILGNREDARDEVQSAYWLAYSRLELFTFQSKFSTWLVRIVINRCLMRLRANQRMPLMANEVLTESGEWYTWDAVTRVTPENEVARYEVQETVRRELRGMPPLLRTPIELHFLSELPVKEVARELGLTVAAAKSRLHRGHLYLRERMLKHAAKGSVSNLTAA